jgi:hypothetical protein
MRYAATSVFVILIAACGGTQDPVAHAPQPSTLTNVVPSRNIHLRATFDDDPTAYVGRFVPDGAKNEDLDENGATTTRCSKFFKPKVVNTNQEMDEVMYVSRQAAASLGIVPVASVTASTGTSSTLRVKYTITKKIQVETDAEGLDACCKADAKQCSGTIIGEFVMGSGEIMQASSADDSVHGSGITPKVKGGADYKDSTSWKRVSTFKDMYFAFQTTATMGRLAAGDTNAKSDDCSWCDTLPGSLDGKYFCGVSPDAPSESMARDLAMRNAREQTVKFLGEYLTTQSRTTSSLKGILDDQQFVTAAAQGLASRVKDEKWCKAEQVPTPDGAKYRSRVLAFFPNAQTQGAAKDAIETIISTRKAAGKLTPAQEADLRSLENGLK